MVPYKMMVEIAWWSKTCDNDRQTFLPIANERQKFLKDNEFLTWENSRKYENILDAKTGGPMSSAKVVANDTGSPFLRQAKPIHNLLIICG